MKRIRILETCILFAFVVELVWFKQVLIKPEYFQITVMTISAFTKFLHFAVQIYGIHIFIISFSTFPGVLWTNLMTSSHFAFYTIHYSAAPVSQRSGFLASLNFFRPPFLNCISYVFNFDDHFSIYFFIMQSKYMVFINSLFHHIKYVVLNHTHFTLTSWEYLLDLRLTCYVWIVTRKTSRRSKGTILVLQKKTAICALSPTLWRFTFWWCWPCENNHSDGNWE